MEQYLVLTDVILTKNAHEFTYSQDTRCATCGTPRRNWRHEPVEMGGIAYCSAKCWEYRLSKVQQAHGNETRRRNTISYDDSVLAWRRYVVNQRNGHAQRKAKRKKSRQPELC